MSFSAEVICRFILHKHNASASESSNSTLRPGAEAAPNTVKNVIGLELLHGRENMKGEVRELAQHALAVENLLNTLVRRLSRATKSRFVASAVSRELEEVLPRWKALSQVIYVHSAIPSHLTGVRMVRNFETSYGHPAKLWERLALPQKVYYTLFTRLLF